MILPPASSTTHPLENGTSLDAFKTMKLITQIYYADPVWRVEYDIQDPTGIHV